MMLLGPLGFLQPFVLMALVALPLLWWLLRLIPPKPEQAWFPPLRLLMELKSKEQTPNHTPWWLLLLRMLIVALVIIALANPVLNPNRLEQINEDKSLVIVVDNGWSSATDWAQRTKTLQTLLTQAKQNSQKVLLIGTANPVNITSTNFKFRAVELAKENMSTLTPQPYEPDRLKVLNVLKDSTSRSETEEAITDFDVVWLSDGMDYGAATDFSSGLAELVATRGQLKIFRNQLNETLGIHAFFDPSGNFKARILRPDAGTDKQGLVHAFNGRGERLGEAAFRFAKGELITETSFQLPLELSNQIAKLEIVGQSTAGSVTLLDSQTKRLRVGLLSGASFATSQPLLAPLYYIERALQPYTNMMRPKEGNLAKSIETLVEQKSSIIIMADIGRLLEGTERRLQSWIKEGGVLIRFAGPRLEHRGDELLPVVLRQGGRVLGGALSWSTPQKLAPFEVQSPFYGLELSDDVTVTRQVLADPARTVLDNQVWARLSDGTPLVTAQKREKGWVILFHVTANPDWSNLPLSGVFVEMLRKLTKLSSLRGYQSQETEQSDKAIANVSAFSEKDFLAPFQVLNGFGQLVEPSSGVKSLDPSKVDATKISASNPPGFYGPLQSSVALNLITEKTSLRLDTSLPSGATQFAYEGPRTLLLQPWLLFAAICLFFIDAMIIVMMSLSMRSGIKRSAPATTAATATLLIAVLFFFSSQTYAQDAHAQNTYEQVIDARNSYGQTEVAQNTPIATQTENQTIGDKSFALSSTLETRLAYILTGDLNVDNISKFGLAGLSRVLAARTAVEPAEPVGVDVAKDELVFFPILYWPVLQDASPLSDEVLAKVDEYMKHGGMILFDTKDYQQNLQFDMVGSNPGSLALQRMIGKLNIPQLEPVPEGHVLTKSFYLLRSFPGRWEAGSLWVESQSRQSDTGEKQARRADGVSSILITSNDFAGAWALNESNRPMLPVVPGGEFQREMAFRTGINIVMYALTGNYKADQVHVPDLLRRLGQ